MKKSLSLQKKYQNILIINNNMEEDKNIYIIFYM